MLMATGALARRIEDAERQLTIDVALAVQRRHGDRVRIAEVSGGVAVYTGPGSPYNKLVGLGFAPLDGAALDRVEEEHARLGAPLQVEYASLAATELPRELCRRGYALMGFENVPGLRLDASLLAKLDAEAEAAAPAVAVSAVAPEELDVWLDLMTDSFLHPDVFDGPAAHQTFERGALEEVLRDGAFAQGFERYFARAGGRIAGGASMRLTQGLAQLSGAGTLPALRRRGVQSTLTRERLRLAARAGCDLAVVTTEPGSKSQENAHRRGFSLLYVRAVLVKPPAG